MLGMPISFPACQKITLFSTAHLLRRVLCIKWKPSLPFNVHSLDSDVDIHQKDTLDLAIHPSCLKALNDGGCLRLNQVLSKELKVKSPPLTSSTPPPQPSTCLRGMLSLANGPQTLQEFDMTN